MSPQLILRPALWPEADRLAWDAALQPADSLFDQNAQIMRKRPRTLEVWAEAYGLWLSYLKRTGIEVARGVDAVTPEQLDAFVADQRARGNNNGTIRRRLGNLHKVLGVVAPERDVSFILRPGGTSLARALPHRPARPDIVDVRILWRYVEELHQGGLRGNSYSAGVAALRDAALLGLLVTRAPRIGAIAAMRLGTHLVERGSRYDASFGEEDDKAHRPLSYPLDAKLSAIFADYQHRARPRLGGDDTDWLWLGVYGGALNVHNLSKIVRRRTKEWLGVARGPHWFRKCLITTAVTLRPELALDAAAVANHTPQTSLQHYNLAQGAAAGARHNDRIEKLRRDTTGLADRLFRDVGVTLTEHLTLNRESR